MMNKVNIQAILFILFFLIGFIAFSQPTTIDTTFDQNIKTVLIFPASDPTQSALLPRAIDISGRVPLILKFDEINVEEANYFYAKIFHCDADWNLSNISERQYLQDFNEFSIDKYEFSSNEKIPYTHFTFEIPRVKIPGNYIIMVYKEGRETNPSFVRRFIVYDKKIGILANSSALGAMHSSTDHQIEFTIDYSNYPVSDPMREIKVVIRQNHRWDNVLKNLQPSFIHPDKSQLVYRNFNLTNNFKAGNEFRFFDLTSVNYTMQNVNRIAESDSRFDAYLLRDKFRGYEAYGILKDMNGGFLVQNKDYPNHHLDGEYVYVHFFLEVPKDVRDDMYVVGRFNDWKTDDKSKLTLNEGGSIYTTTLLLKQGVYDYQYYVPGYSDNPNIIEGNHFETGNTYEILVYFAHPILRTDVLLGYTSFESNLR